MDTRSSTRRSFVKGCVAGASALVSTRTFARENNRPNVVLIVSDDHGRDTLGCYGHPVIKTPNLDALAAEGVRFTNAFCTTAGCSASPSVVLSGLYNHASGQYGRQHSYRHFISFPNVKSLPVLPTKAGYRTGRIGKCHVAPEEVYKFDVALPGNSRSPVQMADNCRDFIYGNDDRPFFLHYCTSDPHRGGGAANDLPGKPDRFGNRAQGSYPGVNEVKYDPNYQKKLTELKAKLKAFQKRTNDPWIVKWDYE